MENIPKVEAHLYLMSKPLVAIADWCLQRRDVKPAQTSKLNEVFFPTISGGAQTPYRK